MNYNKYFTCCKPCKPPTRHPGCHDTCEQYAAAREEYQKDKAALAAVKSEYKEFYGYKKSNENKGRYDR